MHQEIWGLIYAYIFVFATIILSTIIQKLFKLSSYFTRKVIHIVVGHWIFIALYFFPLL